MNIVMLLIIPILGFL